MSSGWVTLVGALAALLLPLYVACGASDLSRFSGANSLLFVAGALFCLRRALFPIKGTSVPLVLCTLALIVLHSANYAAHCVLATEVGQAPTYPDSLFLVLAVVMG